MRSKKAKSVRGSSRDRLAARRMAIQKKLEEGRAFAKEMAGALNHNVANNVDLDRRIQPEAPKTAEDAFLSRLSQYEQSEASNQPSTSLEPTKSIPSGTKSAS